MVSPLSWDDLVRQTVAWNPRCRCRLSLA
jgi:hypothetical protein